MSLPAQYYLTGEVQDMHGDKLQHVSIEAHSTGTSYYSDLSGEFRILSRTMDDTLTFAVDGYDPYTTAVHTTGFLRVTLKMTSFSAGDDRRPVSLIRRPVVRDSGGIAASAGGAAVGAGPLNTGATAHGKPFEYGGCRGRGQGRESICAAGGNGVFCGGGTAGIVQYCPAVPGHGTGSSARGGKDRGDAELF